MIRHATLADVPDLVRLGCAFQASTSYVDDVTANPEAFQAIGETLVNSPDGLLLVLDRRGLCVGMLGGQMLIHHLSWDRVFAELFWFVDPEARGEGIKLLKLAEQWGIEHGATRLIFSAPTDQVGRVYERLGYHVIETAYQRNVSAPSVAESLETHLEEEATPWAI